MVAAQRVNVAASGGDDGRHAEQQSVLRGKRGVIPPRSPSFSMLRRNCHRFNLNAKQRKQNYLCFPFSVFLPRQSLSVGNTAEAFLRVGSAPQITPIIVVSPNKDRSPFCTFFSSSQILQLISPPAVVFPSSCFCSSI